MEKINDLNDIYYDGGIISLKSTSIDKLENIVTEIEAKQEHIKDSIFETIENF